MTQRSGTPSGGDQTPADQQLQAPPVLGVMVSWMEQGACQYTDPEIFFPPPGASLMPARRICHQCPVLAQCQQWALATAEPHGVLGGQSTSERKALAGLMRAWAVELGLTCPAHGPIPVQIQRAYATATAVLGSVAA